MRGTGCGNSAPAFDNLDALNDWLEARCMALWTGIAHRTSCPAPWPTCGPHERPALMPLPRPFDGFVEHTKRVSPTCLVHFERNRYSVPASYANRPVSLRVYADRLVVVAEGQALCEHRRIIHRRHDALGQTVYDWRHYLAVLQTKPGALRNGAPFTGTARRLQAAAGALAQASGRRPRDGRDPGPGAAPRRAAVLAAVELALEAGVPTKTHVLNVLHRLLVEPPAPPVNAPQALRLVIEPRANVLRYDTRVEGPGQPCMPCAVKPPCADGDTLKALKLYGMAQAVAELADQGAPAFDAAQPIWTSCSRPRRPSARCARWPTR